MSPSRQRSCRRNKGFPRCEPKDGRAHWRQHDQSRPGGISMSDDLQQDPAGWAAVPGVSLQLQLLGDFSLHRGQAQVALPLGPQRLLAFLAIKGPAPRPVIMGMLWPEVSEPHARGSLRTALWRLHRGVPCLLRSAGDMLALHPDMQVDIQAMTKSAQVILRDASQVSAGHAVLRIRGELLPGWYDDWVIFERERLRQLRLHALDALAERYTVQGRYADALEAAMESVYIEPLRESANRIVIAIHLAEGNVAEAARHYQFFWELLRAELGLEPSEELTAMLSAVARKAEAASLRQAMIGG
jgi:DNA-binding SARP family transcriptional activator